MADSKLDIWNAAIFRIGETDEIEDEDDDRVAAAACRLSYDRCRRLVLKALRWPFATHQAVIAPLAATRVGWDHVYALPGDCLEPRVLLGEGVRWGLTTPDTRTPFDLMSNDAGDGLVLCCDIGPSDFDALEYTRDIEVVTAFDAGFEDALAWRIAAELELAVKKSRAGWQAIMHPIMGDYSRALQEAAAMAMRGRQDDPEPQAPSMDARR